MTADGPTVEELVGEAGDGQVGWRRHYLRLLTRINEGDEIELPWQVAITRGELASYHRYPNLKGAGVLISPRWVLTVAHNVVPGDGPLFRVHYGASSIRSKMDSVAVAQVVPHPDYHAAQDNDIALLRLAEEITTVSTVNLPQSPDLPPVGTFALVSGWGQTEQGSGSDELRAAAMRLVESSSCTSLDTYYGKDDAQILCAGNTSAGACGRDSGGPLSVEANGSAELIGLIRTHSTCGDGTVNTCTAVAPFMDWIAETTN